ncbi:Fatty acid desaturase [Cupriavidus necator]|uniref:Fatty acid desaturase n=1 Tax=Cupriavidus necator TaxID=106590 RepID=A0A1K0IFV8_CUPNE|nr:Fatty acid desaturase [Cupriavidus necator]
MNEAPDDNGTTSGPGIGSDAERRVNLTRYLTRDEIEQVRARSTWRGIGMIAHCWGTIAAMMALVAWFPNPMTILLAIMVIGSRQLGLAILMHEGAHGGLAGNGKLNLWLSQWFCAYPIGTETLGYRRYHLQHHAHAQTARDPDLSLSAAFPTTRTSLMRKLMRDLTGQTGLKQRKAQFIGAFGASDMRVRERSAMFITRLGRPLLVNALLLAVLSVAGFWWFYPLLWVLPLLTWFQAVTRIRNIAEHSVLPEDNPWRVARTTYASRIERALLAPYWVNYHAEHHMMASVPCYRLERMHKLLRTKGIDGKLEIKPGYLAMLRVAAPRR